jgi:WD40 repeat protein
LEEDAERIADVGFSPDGATLGVVHERDVTLWNVASGRRIGRIAARSGRATADAAPLETLAFSPTGAAFATGDGSGAVVVRDTRTGRDLYRLAGHDSPVAAIAFVPNGRGAVLADRAGRQYLWWFKDRVAAEMASESGPWLPSLAFSSDGRELATRGSDGTITLRDGATADPQRVLDGAVPVGRLALSPDGSRLAVGDDLNVGLWRVARGELDRAVRLGGPIQALRFTRDGASLVAVDAAGDVVVWDLQSDKTSSRWLYCGKSIATVALSPIALDIAVASVMGDRWTLKLWSADAVRERPTSVTRPGMRTPLSS